MQLYEGWGCKCYEFDAGEGCVFCLASVYQYDAHWKEALEEQYEDDALDRVRTRDPWTVDERFITEEKAESVTPC